MFNLSNMKLRSLLILIIMVALSMMGLIQIFYYNSFNSLTKERARAYFGDLMQQIEENMDKSLNEMEHVVKTVSKSRNVQKFILETDNYQKFNLLEYASDILQYIISGKNEITAIRVVGRDGVTVRVGGGTVLGQNEIERLVGKITEEYELVKSPLTNGFYSKSYYIASNRKFYYALVQPIFASIEGEFHSENIGVCIILCDLSALFGKIGHSGNVNDMIFMLTEEDQVILSNNPSLLGKKLDVDLNLKEGAGEVLFNHRKCIAQTYVIRKTGWKIFTLIPISELVKDLLPVRTIGTILLAITAVLLVLVEVFVMRGISEPINKMVREMERIKGNDIKFRLKIPSKNEVGALAEDINLMLDRLEEMTRRIFHTQNSLYELELSKKRAELAFFQSQINPHFLYNTLECIRSMSEAYHAGQIAEVATAMAKIFRYSVKEAVIVTVRDEMESVKDYFKIISVRYMGKFKLKSIIDEDVLDIRILKMILQPIVENSVRHGLEGTKKAGFVCIQGQIDLYTGMVVIRIADNGRGMEQSKVEELNRQLEQWDMPEQKDTEKASIGLININRRLKLSYGPEYGVRIRSRNNFWTVVEVTIPTQLLPAKASRFYSRL